MLRSSKELRGYQLQTLDGEIGRVHEFLMDDETWNARYLVANTGPWLAGRLVLLAPEVIGDPDWDRRIMPVRLTRQQVEDSPSIDADQPVSRRHQKNLHSYYGWPMYWVMSPAHGVIMPAAPPDVAEGADGNEGDAHLRSTREVVGYSLRATDGDVGRVNDFIVDDDEWVVRYLVVDTGNWLPGRKVLISPSWVASVEWKDKDVHVDVTREQIEKSPEYDAKSAVNRQYEERLYDFLGRPKYW